MFLDVNLGTLTETDSSRRWGSKEISSQIEDRVLRYRNEGMTGGDRVFLHFGNRLEFFVDLLAIWRIGACAIPIDPRLTSFEVKTLAQTASPRFSIIDDQTDSSTVSQLESVDVKVVNTLELKSWGIEKNQRAGPNNYPQLMTTR